MQIIDYMAPLINHNTDLLKRLTSRRYAAKYLRFAFEDGDESSFLLALKNVVEAQGGISKLAAQTKLSRQHLHKILSDNGNPTLSSLKLILNAIGIRIDFSSQLKLAA
jgi:probable addiction module antidote protein